MRTEELRRIERDLHDGAQARLVALAIDIGLAKEKLAADPASAGELMASAHEEAKTALAELRELVRGVHPAILKDRGLDAALSALAARSPVPVQVDAAVAARLPPAVETAAYFVVAEALTNVAKHSGASACTVYLRRANGQLSIDVCDNGAGGADVARGSGLAGLGARVRALDGTLVVDSPARGSDAAAGGGAVRAVIAEDLALLRDGLQRLLREGGFEIAAAVADGESLVAAIEAERPEVSIVDVRLPPTFRDEGIRAALEARRRVPGTRMVVLSQYVEQLYARELLADRAGGVGYLLKDRVADVADFVAAVRTVAEGGTVMDPEVVRQLVVQRAAPLAELTPREKEVLALMAQGRSNNAIAGELVITVGAVEKHVSSIFGKLRLAASEEVHRRVLAVLAYLQSAD